MANAERDNRCLARDCLHFNGVAALRRKQISLPAMSRLAVEGAPVANLWPLREEASFGVAYNAGRLIGYISGFPDMVPAFASAEQVANIADRLSEVVEAERRRRADAP